MGGAALSGIEEMILPHTASLFGAEVRNLHPKILR
jgi:hypothetical protein